MTPTESRPIETQGHQDPEQLLRDVYRDLTVCLGGVFAVHKDDIADTVVWEISRALGGMFRQHRRQIVSSDATSPAEQYRPHPAIVHLLRELQAVTS